MHLEIQLNLIGDVLWWILKVAWHDRTIVEEDAGRELVRLHLLNKFRIEQIFRHLEFVVLLVVFCFFIAITCAVRQVYHAVCIGVNHTLKLL